MTIRKTAADLRSKACFDNPEDVDQTAQFLEHYINYGLTREELQSGRPMIGIAQTGSDLTPCNRHHLTLATRIKDGIRDAGGIPIEFPLVPIQETTRRPTSGLDRNLQCAVLCEILHGYPLDGVVLTTGCDKTTPGQIMAAASVNIPALALNSGPMLNGFYKGQCVGSGMATWEARKKIATGEIGYEEFIDIVGASARSTGHCNTMGTALTMNCLAEAMGMALPGSAAIPAPYRDRQQMAYRTGKRIVEMVWEDVKPCDVITRAAIENAIVVCAALGGSTNAPIHINAIAAHAGVKVIMEDWQTLGHSVPLLVNCQPSGEYLAEEFYRAGGLPAVLYELNKAGLLNSDALMADGRTLGEVCASAQSVDPRVIKSTRNPLKEAAGFMVLSGNLFTSGLLKTSAITPEFHERYFADPGDPGVCELTVAVFDGPEDYKATIENPDLDIDGNTVLVMRGAGSIGYPGAAEVVNMQPPAHLIKQGIKALPTMGDGRQSGTSDAPSVLNISPEAAAGGGLAILRNGDRLRIDLNNRRVDLLLGEDEIEKRFETLDYKIPESQTWWQKVFREKVSGLDKGAIFEDMVAFRDLAKKEPRKND